MSSKIIEEDSEKISDDSPSILIGDDDSQTLSDSITKDIANIKSSGSTFYKDPQSDELTADVESPVSVQSLDDDEHPLADSSPLINLGTSSERLEGCRKNSVDEEIANESRTIQSTVLESNDQSHGDFRTLVDVDDQSDVPSAVFDGSATSVPPDDAEQPANKDVQSNDEVQAADPYDEGIPVGQSDVPITVVPLDDDDELEVDSVLDEYGERLLRVRKREEAEVENEEQERQESLVDSENLTEGILDYFLKKISQFGLNPLLVYIHATFQVIHSFYTAF